MTTLDTMVSERIRLASSLAFWTERSEMADLDDAMSTSAATLARYFTEALARADAEISVLGRDAACPVWCTIEHAPGWPIHSCRVGEVEAEDEEGPADASVELNDYGNGRGPAVSLGIHTEQRAASIEFTSAQARTVAALLVLAAGTLDASGGGRR